MNHLRPPALRVVMRGAARMLEEHAESMRSSCEGGTPTRDWSCDDCPARDSHGKCRGKSMYEREMATAALLRDAAKNGKLRTG